MSNNMLPPENEIKHKIVIQPFHRFFIGNHLISIILFTLLFNARILQTLMDIFGNYMSGYIYWFIWLYYMATFFFTPFILLFYIKESENKKYGAYMLVLDIVLSIIQVPLFFIGGHIFVEGLCKELSN
jgi:hypothetical protein